MIRRLAIVAAGAVAVGVGLVWAILPEMPERLSTRGRLVEGRIEIDGIERRYDAYLPPGLAPRAPLLFVLHGSGMDPAVMRDAVGWRFAWLADRDGFIVVYPAGFENEWNGCRSPGVTEADRRNLDDVGFALELIRLFQRDYRIDAARVYAAGFSNGGSMAYRLASDAPGRFAAIAAIAAQVPEPDNSKCRSPRGPIPVLIMNGTDDPIVPWEGGKASLFGFSSRGRVQSTRASVAHWLAVNGIAGDPTIHELPDLDPDDGSTAVRSRWGEAGANEVVLIAIHGGAHTIPAGPRLGSAWLTERFVGHTNRDIVGADEVWTFLRSHRRPGGRADPI